MVSSSKRILAATGILLSAAAICTPATAQGMEDKSAIEAAPPAASTTPGSALFGTQALVDGDLGRIAGREDLSLVAQADLVATSRDNKVGDDVVTGDITISDSAFQNLSGLTLLNINSGNNSAINASMNVNIVISPPNP